MDKLKNLLMVGVLTLLSVFMVLNIFFTVNGATAAEPAAANTVYYFEDFEDSDGGYTHTATGDGPSSWEWGTPNYTNIAAPSFSLTSAHSGLKAWGTDLDSEYENRVSQTLTSPVIDVSTVPDGEQVYLEWWQAWQIEDGFDKGYAEVRIDGNVWFPLPNSFDGTSDGWVRHTINISSATNTIQIRWTLESDDVGNEAGLYIDDVAVRTAGSAIVLETTVGRDPQRCGTDSSITVPHSNTTVYYCYTVTNIGDIDLTLYDLVDSELGTLRTAASYDLTSTYQITIPAVIDNDMENMATWTTYNQESGLIVDTASASSSASVSVFVNGDLPTTSQPPNTTASTVITLNNPSDTPLDWGVSHTVRRDTAGSADLLATAWLYENGPFINSSDSGVGGTDESVAQNNSLGLTTLGFNHTSPLRIADEFTVPNTADGWSISTITFYAFQTDSTTESTITDLNLQIWDGPPNQAGSSVIFGDTSTNRLLTSEWTGVYRVNEESSGTNTRRPIMANTAEVGVTLSPGTYWLDWQTAGSLSGGTFAPPITINGETTTGNALLFNGNTWTNVEDTGTNTAQGFPFALSGCAASLPDWVSMSASSGTIAPGDSQTVEVTFDAASRDLGTYTGELCLIRNDAQLPAVTIPLTMNVVEPAHLRLAHLAPFDTDPHTAVDIALDGTVILSNVSFLDSTPYLDMVPGTYQVDIYPTGNTVPILSDLITIEGGSHYTAIATGGTNGYDLELVTFIDETDPAPSGAVKVRITHLSPFAASLEDTVAELRADGTPSVLATLSYGGTRDGYLVLAPGRYDLNIAKSDTAEIIVDLAPFNLEEGQILDIIAIGDGQNQELGVFAYPADAEGYLLGTEGEYTYYMPLISVD